MDDGMRAASRAALDSQDWLAARRAVAVAQRSGADYRELLLKEADALRGQPFSERSDRVHEIAKLLASAKPTKQKAAADRKLARFFDTYQLHHPRDYALDYLKLYKAAMQAAVNIGLLRASAFEGPGQGPRPRLPGSVSWAEDVAKEEAARAWFNRIPRVGRHCPRSGMFGHGRMTDHLLYTALPSGDVVWWLVRARDTIGHAKAASLLRLPEEAVTAWRRIYNHACNQQTRRAAEVYLIDYARQLLAHRK